MWAKETRLSLNRESETSEHLKKVHFDNNVLPPVTIQRYAARTHVGVLSVRDLHEIEVTNLINKCRDDSQGILHSNPFHHTTIPYH